MRIARFSYKGTPRYAFVQTDKQDGKDYLVELSGYPLTGQQVEPTGQRYPLDDEDVRLLAPVIPSKIYGAAKNYRAHELWPPAWDPLWSQLPEPPGWFGPAPRRMRCLDQSDPLERLCWSGSGRG